MCALVYISPLVGIAFVLKSFSRVCGNLLCVHLSHRLYIYILLFCGDPFNIHLRAPPTLDDGDLSDTVGREDDDGFLGPQ